jgi:putative ABC transport system substrate-binding protein
VQRVGELQVPTNPIARIARAERQGGLLPPVGIELIYVDALQAGDLESAIAEAARRGAQALHVRPEPIFAQNFHQIVLEAQRHELPILADNDEFLDGGALVSYGPDNEDLDRLLAYYIDKILRGAKPADLPIQQPRKFDLGINRKVAKSLGIRIPQSILLRAGKVVD